MEFIIDEWILSSITDAKRYCFVAVYTTSWGRPKLARVPPIDFLPKT